MLQVRKTLFLFGCMIEKPWQIHAKGNGGKAERRKGGKAEQGEGRMAKESFVRIANE